MSAKPAMPDRPAICSNPGCGREIARKNVLCRPCAKGHTRDRHPYIEPCARYVAEPVAHLQGFLCAECGFDSAEHPGRGRVALTKVRIVS